MARPKPASRPFRIHRCTRTKRAARKMSLAMPTERSRGGGGRVAGSSRATRSWWRRGAAPRGGCSAWRHGRATGRRSGRRPLGQARVPRPGRRPVIANSPMIVSNVAACNPGCQCPCCRHQRLDLGRRGDTNAGESVGALVVSDAPGLRAPIAGARTLHHPHAELMAVAESAGELVRKAIQLAHDQSTGIVRVDCWAHAPRLLRWYEPQGLPDPTCSSCAACRVRYSRCSSRPKARSGTAGSAQAILDCLLVDAQPNWGCTGI